MRVLSRDSAGALVFVAGRFVSVSGTEAKAQLLRERLSMRQGDDTFRPLRGAAIDALLEARATPAALASALGEEARLEPLVRSATATPIGTGFVTRVALPGESRQRAAIEVRAVLRPDSEVVLIPLEVSLG